MGESLDGVLGWFFRLFNRTFEGFKAIYIRILRKLIRWSLLVLVVYGGLLVLTGYMFQKVPTGFIPETDQGFIFVNVELPEGASLERTEQVMNQVESILKSTPVLLIRSIGSGARLSRKRPRRIAEQSFASLSPLRNGKRIRRSRFAASWRRPSRSLRRFARRGSRLFRLRRCAD